MNFSNLQIKNYVFSSFENDDNIKEFAKIAVSLISKKQVVLLFTRKHVDFIPMLAGLSKEQMTNFIIFYHSDIYGVIKKLLELHDWTIFPDLVILNLNSYFDVADAVPPFKDVCFCISSLFNYMSSLGKQRIMHQHELTQISAKSVTLLNQHRDVQIQLLVDFYFYKMSAFNELDKIKNAILN